MRSGTCPKCGTEDVYFLEGQTHRSTLEHRGWADLTNTTDYVCGNCGYVEEYLRTSEDMEKVRQRWQRVDRNREGSA